MSVTELWPCEPLQRAAVSIAAFGGISVLVGLTCSCYVCKTGGWKAAILCIIVGALVLLAVAATATESSYGLGNDYNFMRNHSYIRGCTKYDANAALPVSLVMVTYFLLSLMIFYFIAVCVNAITRNDPILYR